MLATDSSPDTFLCNSPGESSRLNADYSRETHAEITVTSLLFTSSVYDGSICLSTQENIWPSWSFDQRTRPAFGV